MLEPHRIEIGERYSDDSGWKMRVCVDTHKKEVEITADGNSMTCTLADAEWIIQAMSKALDTVDPRR